MRTSMLFRVVLCCMVVALVVGCQTLPCTKGLKVGPVVPRENEQIVRDQLIVLVDATGSLNSARAFSFEKGLVQAFTGAMPDGKYESGINSFGGVPCNLWLKQPLAPFNRDAMVKGAASLKMLGSTTPLDRALLSLKPQITGKGGNGALLVFSDGKVCRSEPVLEACKALKAAHGGKKLCIFTVHIGPSDCGKKLMHEMADINGCGKYYDGTSLNSAAGIEGLVRDIFFGPKEVPKPAPKPAPWKLRIILFDNDSAVVAPSYDAELDEAAAIMKANPKIRVRAEGHTDSNASSEYNVKLSERRANAVKEALVKRGVDAARIEAKCYGEEKPAVPNDTKDNRHKNRRVELSAIE